MLHHMPQPRRGEVGGDGDARVPKLRAVRPSHVALPRSTGAANTAGRPTALVAPWFRGEWGPGTGSSVGAVEVEGVWCVEGGRWMK